MKKFLKQLIFTILFICNCLYFYEPVHAEIVEGTYGTNENITWSYDDSNNTLVISGQGEMESANASDYPWYSYRADLKKVVVTEGVSSIGANCFYYYSSALQEVILPNSVIEIGTNAFSNCGNLTSINLSSITKFNKNSFNNCPVLTNIGNLHNNITSIPEGCFAGCKKIQNINISNSVTSIGDSAFQNCSLLTEIIIPNADTTLGISVFSGCTNLNSVTLPANLTEIPRSCFYNCKNLQHIEIPENVTSLGTYAFSGCENITQIQLPEGITNIESNCFTNTRITEFVWPENVTNIPSNCFSNCKNLTKITIPDTVLSIEEQVFNNCTSLSEITLSPNITTLPSGLFNGCTSLDYVIPSNITEIGSQTFKGCTSLKNAIIPETVTSIGQETFSGCSSLQQVSLPNTISKLSTSLFLNCSSIEDITIPNSVITLGSTVFKNCTNLKNITLSENLTKIDSGCFSGCSSLETISFPNTLNTLESSAFQGCSLLNNITLPENLTTLKNYAFQHCTSLTNIVIPSQITKLYGGTFGGCLSLNNIELPEGLTEIDSSCFESCESLTTIILPTNLESLGGGCFKNSGLKNITIPNKIILLDQNTFLNCTYLEKVEILGNVTSFGSNCFKNCTTLSEINIPTSLTTIGKNCFEECDSLSSLDISSVTDLKNYAFLNCSNLSQIILSDNLTTINGETFSGCVNLTTINMPTKLQTINYEAFYNCKKLNGITLPNTLTTLARNAFEKCYALTEITIPNGITLNEGTFKDCTSLTTVSLGNATSIAKSFFYGCTSLNLTVPSSVTTIGTSAFNKVNHVVYENPEAFTSVYGASQNHIYDEEYTIDVEPTCTTEGSKSQHCIYNGCTATQNNSIVEPSHNYGEWTYENNNDVVDGYRYAACIYCETEKAEEYYIDITTDEHTTLTVSGNYIPLNDTYTTTAIPDVGYEFKGYSGDVEENDTILTIDAVDKAMSISANSVPKTNTPYIVNHYTKNTETGEYDLYKTESLEGITDSTICPEVLDITGYELNGEQEDVVIKGDGSTVIDYYYDLKKCTVTLVKGDGHIASITLNKITGDGSTYGSTFTITPTFYYGYGLNTITDNISDEVYENIEHVYTLTDDITITVSSKCTGDIKSMYDYTSNGYRWSRFYRDNNVLIPNLHIYIKGENTLYTLSRENGDSCFAVDDKATTYPRFITHGNYYHTSSQLTKPYYKDGGYWYPPYAIYQVDSIMGYFDPIYNPIFYVDKTYETATDFKNDIAKYNSSVEYFNGIYEELGINAKYTVNHYVENLETCEYELYKSEELSEAIGNYVNPKALTIDGYSIVSTRQNVKVDENTIIDYYYDLNEYEITLEKGDENVSNITLNVLTGNDKKYGSTFKIVPNFKDGYKLNIITVNGKTYSDAETEFTITDNLIIYVTSTPNTDTPYNVNHHIQKLDNLESYELYQTESKTGTTNETITVSANGIEGFTAKENKQTITISGNGDSVVDFYYDRNSYDVILNIPEEGIESVSGDGEYLFEEEVTLNTVVTKGYKFNGYTGDLQNSNSEMTFIMPSKDIVVNANVTCIDYQINYELDEGLLENPKTSYNVNTSAFDINIPTKDEYNFIGWDVYLDNELIYDNVMSLKIDPTIILGNLKLIANWQQIVHNYSDYIYEDHSGIKDGYRYKKCVDCNKIIDEEYLISITKEHTSLSVEDSYIDKGSAYSTIATGDKGYHFVKFEGDVNQTQFVLIIDNVIKPYKITAISEVDINTEYTVKHYIKDKTTGEYILYKEETLVGITDSVVSPEPLEIPTYSLSGDVQEVKINGDGSTIVSYYYDLKEYTITLVKGDENVTDIALNIISGDGKSHGSTFTIIPTFVSGYHLDQITNSISEDIDVNGSKIYTLTDNMVITVTSKPNTNTKYTVNYYVQNINDTDYELFNSISYEGITNETITVSANEIEGFTAVEKTKDIIIKGDGTSTIDFYYNRNSYDVSILYNENAISSILGIGTYKYGEDVTIQANVNEGYTFGGYTGYITDSNPNITFKMPAQNVSLEIKTIQGTGIEYTVNHYIMQIDGTYSQQPNKTVSYIGNTDEELILSNYKDVGLEVTDAIIYKNGFVDNVETLSTNIKADGSTILDLYYERAKFEVSFSVGDNMQAFDKKEIYYYESLVTLPTVLPKDGYSFVGWINDCELNIRDNMFTMPAKDVSFIANAEYITYTIDYELNDGVLNNQVLHYNVEMPNILIQTPMKLGCDFIGWDIYKDDCIIEEKVKEYTIVTTDLGNYKLIAYWKQQPISIENLNDLNYTGSELKHEDIVIKVGETVLSSDNYDIFYENNKNIGIGKIKVVLKNGYEGTFEKEFLIQMPNDYTFEHNGILYQVCKDENGKYYIKVIDTTFDKDNKTITEITIPEELEVGGIKIPITTIGSGSFSNCPYLETITLPKNVSSVEPGAFTNCEKLKEIKSNNNTIIIDKKVFVNCTNIINYPGKEDIKDSNDHSDPTPEPKPEEETSIIGKTFTIKNIKYKVLSSTKVSVIGTNKKSSIKTIIIPKTVKINEKSYKVVEISKNAFKNCKKVTKVKIGNNVTKIGSNAFLGCKKLKSLSLSSKLTKIDSSAFKNCKSLTKVIIPKKVTTIGKNAFYGCKKLKSITIKGKALKSIGKSAIKGIYKKAVINVPNSKIKSYKKLFKSSTGYKKTMKIK